MAGGHGSPAENLQNLSKAELLLHKIAMNRARRMSAKQTVDRKASGIYPVRESFALEDHKLKNKVDQLEKEKQQCIHRHKEDAHVFRMSVKLPPQRSEEYWSQYGEKFHANGDWRENYALLRLPPQPSPRQQSGKPRKERHGSCDISKNIKPKPCKTVSDLITLMREVAPIITNPDAAAQTCPLSSSSMTEGLHHQNPVNVRSESLQRLRVLLENYEMFVPCGSEEEDQEDDDDEDEEKEKEKDKSLNEEVEDTKNTHPQSRSKSVDDIKKVELLRASRVRGDRLAPRSQSAQANHVKQGLQERHRKRNSAPARDIANGALRVRALNPSVCKYDIKNQSLTKSSETLFKLPSKRVPERTESSASLNESDSEKKIELDENNGSLIQECSPIPRGIESRNRSMKSARRELSFKKVWTDKKDSPESMENTHAGRQQKSVNEEDNFEGSETLKEESLGTISYCFSETGEFFSTAEETDLHIRKIPVRITSGYPREVTSRSRTSRDVCSRRARYEDRHKSRSPSDSFPPGKVSIKNILPEFPLDIETLRRASKKSMVSAVNEDTNPARKPQRYWRPKPKSASPFGRKGSTLAEHDAKGVNRQPDHLAHASVKARRPLMVVLGKGLDKKKQEKETREKMDQFFARLDSTKNNEKAPEQHTATPTRPNTATLRSRERRLKIQEYQRKTGRMYKRAAPWPVQVWC